MNPNELLNKEFKVPNDNKLRRWPSTPVVIVKEEECEKKKKKYISESVIICATTTLMSFFEQISRAV